MNICAKIHLLLCLNSEASFLLAEHQPQAIQKLVDGVNDGLRTQVLLGVTGSGKTFTMANVIKECNRPALVIAQQQDFGGATMQ